MKKRILITTIAILFTFGLTITSVMAQRRVENDVEVQPGGVDGKLDLHEIRIPFFGQPAFLEQSEYYSLFSWISFFGVIFSVGLIIFWVFLIVKAAFKAVRSEGNEEGLGESYQRTKSVFVGAAISIAVPLAISVFGYALGLGPLWSWPAGLRDCADDNTVTSGSTTSTKYFFQKVLELEESGAEDPVAEAEEQCFGSKQIGNE